MKNELKTKGDRMSNVVAADFSKIESVLLGGDLSRLTSEEKISYYNKVCSSLGLNPLTKPFDYIKLNGKEVLYAKRDAADQLRKVHSVAIKITARELMGDVYVVTAQASTPDGRADESTGAVAVQGLKGESLANAYMKAETKAKRRVTLSICGLGMLDETEVETVKAAARDVRAQAVQEQIAKGEPAPDLEMELTSDFEPGLGDYVIRVGKNKGKHLSDVSTHDLKSFIDWYNAKVDGDPDFNPHPDLVQYHETAIEYLAALKGAP